MGLPIPNLDDKTFEDLVKEARALIPLYTKEWTDHNIHDPGITFIELFAWLAEMQIYQLNRVTEANYIKFLKLLGLQPSPAQPARVNVTFEKVGSKKRLEKGSQLIPKMGGEEIVFETEDDFTLVPLSLEKITVMSDGKTIDKIQANREADIYFSPFMHSAAEGAILELGFDTHPSIKEVESEMKGSEIRLFIDIFEGDLSPMECSESVVPSVQLAWEYSTGAGWEPLAISMDSTFALTRSGWIAFTWPLDLDNKKGGFYRVRCRLVKGGYEIPPRINTIRLNTVSAVQIESVEDKIAGTGLPGQKVILKKSPVIPKSLKIEFDGDTCNWGSSDFRVAEFKDCYTIEALCKKLKGDGFDIAQNTVEELNKLLITTDLYVRIKKKIPAPSERLKKLEENYQREKNDDNLRRLNRIALEECYPQETPKSRNWEEVADFDSSGPADRRYTFNPADGIITFGNGLNGLIPQKNQNIKASYRITMGEKGNIPGGQEFWINETGYAAFSGTNEKEAVGGKNAESIEEGKERAKKDLRTTCRAITAADYEELAVKTPGIRVKRAQAVPGYHPTYRCTSIPGAVTVVVVPEALEGTVSPPVPGEGFLQTVLNYLETHRLVTTALHVVGPEYVTVSVYCKVHVKKKSDPEKVKERVEKRLRTFLDPFTGGPEQKGWPFGRPVYPSEIYQMIDKVAGVDYVANVFLSAESDDGQHRRVGDVIAISPLALVHSGNHKVITSDSQVEFVKISVNCEACVKEVSDPTVVKRYIKKELESFLDPLKGGPEKKGWPPGRAVDPAEIRQILKKVDGVDCIRNITLCEEGGQYREGTISIPEAALAVSGEHHVNTIPPSSPPGGEPGSGDECRSGAAQRRIKRAEL